MLITEIKQYILREELKKGITQNANRYENRLEKTSLLD